MTPDARPTPGRRPLPEWRSLLDDAMVSTVERIERNRLTMRRAVALMHAVQERLGRHGSGPPSPFG